jgi:hypothetical protein
MERCIFSICLDSLPEIRQGRWFQCDCMWLMFETQGLSDFLLSHARQKSDNISIMQKSSFHHRQRHNNAVCLRQVPWPFRSEFSTDCDLVLPLPIYSIFYFPGSHSVLASYLLPRLPVTSTLLSMLPSIVCFRRQCLRKMRQIQLDLFRYVVFMIFLPHLTLNNTFSFPTRSV